MCRPVPPFHGPSLDAYDKDGKPIGGKMIGEVVIGGHPLNDQAEIEGNTIKLSRKVLDDLVEAKKRPGKGLWVENRILQNRYWEKIASLHFFSIFKRQLAELIFHFPTSAL
jgi:hypothetical protein